MNDDTEVGQLTTRLQLGSPHGSNLAHLEGDKSLAITIARHRREKRVSINCISGSGMITEAHLLQQYWLRRQVPRRAECKSQWQHASIPPWYKHAILSQVRRLHKIAVGMYE